MPTIDSSQEQRSDPRQTFLRYLPDRVEAMEDGWRALVDKGWSTAKLAQLLQRGKDLSNVASQFAFTQLNNGLLPLIESFQALLEVKQTPSIQQLEQVSALLRRFAAICQDNGRTMGNVRKNHNELAQIVFYLCGSEALLAPGLNSALTAVNYQLIRFNSATDLLHQLDASPPSVLIVDAKMLPEFAPSLIEIAKNTNQTGSAMPVLVILSTTGTLETRLLALRAGAVAFFIAPIDVQAVADRIQQLVGPAHEPPYRILVMDDDSSQAEFAAAIIRKNGLDSRTVTDPMGLLDAIAEFGPDLVLMDLYMPNMNGLELTKIIREQTDFISLPIVFMSGEQDADKQLEALSVGGDDFITKPVRPKRLLTLIKSRILRARASRPHLKEPNNRDPITGLLNRRALFEKIDHILTHGNKNLAYGLFLLEIDDMSGIRSAIGSGLAEVFLAGLSTRLMSVIDPKDLCTRIDDNRFAIVANRAQDAALVGLGEDLIQAVAQRRFAVEGLNKQPSLSIGLCRFYPATNSAVELEQRAVSACINAVNAGGNRLVVEANDAQVQQPVPATVVPTSAPATIFAETEQSKAQDQLLIFKQALRDDKFQIQLQRFVGVPDPKIGLQELQWRWTSQSGVVGAAEILALAKQSSGFSREIDRWLLGKALDMLRESRQSGHQVNLLVHQTVETIADQRAAAWLREELRRRLLVGTGLILKFNLADIATDVKVVRNLMGELAVMGVEICLGRFGNNDASQKILKYLKTQYVKIPEKLLVVDQAIVAKLLEQTRESNSKIILSRTHDPKIISRYWLAGANFVQANAAQ